MDRSSGSAFVPPKRYVGYSLANFQGAEREGFCPATFTENKKQAINSMMKKKLIPLQRFSFLILFIKDTPATCA